MGWNLPQGTINDVKARSRRVMSGAKSFYNRSFNERGFLKNQAADLFGTSQLRSMGGMAKQAWKAGSNHPMNYLNGRQGPRMPMPDLGEAARAGWNWASGAGKSGWGRAGAVGARAGLAYGAAAAVDFLNPFSPGWND